MKKPSASIVLLLCVVVLTFFVGCNEKTDVNKHSIETKNENRLYEKLPSSDNHSEAYNESESEELLKLWQIFEYDGVEYDLSEIYSGVNGVSKWGEIGKYIIAEGHVNPYNSIYAVINTETKSMEHSFAGSAPTYYDGDINTIVYAFWNTVKKYDGSVLAELSFAQGEYISELAYIENGELIKVTISNDDTFLIDVNGNIRTEDVEKLISENKAEITIGAYIVSPIGEEIRVRDTEDYKEYTVNLSFCLDHTPKEGSFYWITGTLDSSTNRITVEFPEKFHCPQRYEHTEEGDLPLRVYAVNVTDTGLTVRFELTDFPEEGQLQTGEWYEIEKYENDEWNKVKTVISDYGFNALAYLVKENDITELEVNWEWLYGKLSPGHYRINKKVMNFRNTGDFDEKIYNAHFVIA